MGIHSKAGLQKNATACGSPAEKWFAYFNLKSSVLGEFVRIWIGDISISNRPAVGAPSPPQHCPLPKVKFQLRTTNLHSGCKSANIFQICQSLLSVSYFCRQLSQTNQQLRRMAALLLRPCFGERTFKHRSRLFGSTQRNPGPALSLIIPWKRRGTHVNSRDLQSITISSVVMRFSMFGAAAEPRPQRKRTALTIVTTSDEP